MNAHNNNHSIDTESEQTDGDNSQKSSKKGKDNNDSNVPAKKRTSFLYFDGACLY